MKDNYDTFPDDLRLRYQYCFPYRNNLSAFPPFDSRPFTVIAGLMNGKAEIEFAGHGRKPLFLHAGDVCFLQANCRRHSRSLSPAGAEFIIAGFFYEIRGGMDFLSFFDIPPRMDKLTGKKLFSLLEELLGLETDSAKCTDLQKKVSRQRIGYAMLENILTVAKPIPGMLPVRRLLPAIEHLNGCFNIRPDLPGLMKMSGFSRTHFFRIFKAQTGTTPIEFVKRRRLREALLLLQESDLNISEIGDKVGWPDPFYFSKIFKAKIGMPPSVYRLRHRKINISVAKHT